MDIVMHDYAGHPFQVQLSRELGCPAATTYGINTARPTRRVGGRFNAVQTIRNGSR